MARRTGAVAEKLVTAEELARMNLDYPCELVEGKIVRTSPAGASRHGFVAARIHALLVKHVARKKLGLVVSAETGYRTKRRPDSVRAPDLAFVSNETVELTERSGETFAPRAPDLAVEVVSPDDKWAEVEAKAREYLDAGSKLVWVVNPRSETVYVYEPGIAGRVLGARDAIDGGAAIPGFKARVAAFFAEREPRRARRRRRPAADE